MFYVLKDVTFDSESFKLSSIIKSSGLVPLYYKILTRSGAHTVGKA